MRILLFDADIDSEVGLLGPSRKLVNALYREGETLEYSTLSGMSLSNSSPQNSGNSTEAESERVKEMMEDSEKTSTLNQHEQSSHKLTETKAECKGPKLPVCSKSPAYVLWLPD